jgi:SPP1 gp7 family putative phage head morphogenesis protein
MAGEASAYEIYRRMAEFNRQLAGREAASMLEMIRRWKLVEDDLWSKIDGLARQIAKDGIKTDGQLFRMYRYSELVKQAQDEIDQYEVWAAQYIQSVQRREVDFGLEAAVRSVYGDRFFAPRIYKGAVERMIAGTQAGAPLAVLLGKRALAGKSIEGLTRALINGMAQGWNPRKTARAMADELAQGLDKALVIARTEQIRSFREATREQYGTMGITQYQRHCAKSDRTCLACLALDGKVYEQSEIMDSHPNCRCFTVAVIAGDVNEHASAQEWFGGLDEKRQKEILGPGHFDLYKQGVPLSEMAKVTDNPVWGPTLGVRPLSEMMESGKYSEKFSVDALLRVTAQGKHTLNDTELARVVDQVGKAGFDQAVNVRVPKKYGGFEVDGQKLQVGGKTNTGYYHYAKHVLENGEWPAGTSYNDYVNDLQQMVQDKRSGILLNRYPRQEWQVSVFGSASWDEQKIVQVNYRLSRSAWMTGHVLDESLDDFMKRVKDSQWLRQMK